MFEASACGLQLFTLHSRCSPPPSSRMKRKTDAHHNDHNVFYECNNMVNQCLAWSGFI